MDNLPLSTQEAAELSKRIKTKQRPQKKTNITRETPLKHVTKDKQRRPYSRRWQRGNPEPNDSEKLREIERQIEATALLPAASSYASHRLKVLNKAKELLQAPQ